MKLKEIYSSKKPVISYEVFPPKDDDSGEKLENLMKELNLLKQYNPSLISVTYGAGGSNRDTSLEIVKELNIPVCFVGVGEGLDDLDEFNAKDFVEAIF